MRIQARPRATERPDFNDDTPPTLMTVTVMHLPTHATTIGNRSCRRSYGRLMRWPGVAIRIAICLLCVACSGPSSVSAGDRNTCTSWVTAATAVNRGSASGSISASNDNLDVSSLLANAAYAGNFRAVAASAASANDPALRGATATLAASLEATANHATVDRAVVLDAMATLTRRCLELGFRITAVSSR
jgi:hypothetical protein